GASPRLGEMLELLSRARGRTLGPVSAVRREEDEASLPPTERSAAPRDTASCVGDGESAREATLEREPRAACGETSRTRERPTTGGDRGDRPPAPPSKAKCRARLPGPFKRSRWKERGRRTPVGPATTTRSTRAPRKRDAAPQSANGSPRRRPGR